MIQEIDFFILDFIRLHLSCEFLDITMPVVTSLANGGFICILITLLLLFLKKYRYNGIILGLSLITGLLCGNIIIKNAVKRIRPCVLRNVDIIINVPGGYSFPSGHTLATIIMAVSLFGVNKKAGIAATVFAAVVAFSRIYLYVHYPSDVLFGAVLGVIIAVSVKKLIVKYRITDKKTS